MKNFDDFDFTPIVKLLEQQKEIRKNKTPEEKKVIHALYLFYNNIIYRFVFYTFIKHLIKISIFRKKKMKRQKKMKNTVIV